MRGWLFGGEIRYVLKMKITQARRHGVAYARPWIQDASILLPWVNASTWQHFAIIAAKKLSLEVFVELNLGLCDALH